METLFDGWQKIQLINAITSQNGLCIPAKLSPLMMTIKSRFKTLRRALLRPCKNLRELPANDELPFLSTAPLRVSGYYPYPMSLEALGIDGNEEVLENRQERIW